ncbi:ParB-like protein [Mycetocola lacteus]|uniref:ParB-like protein n=1 Tax=Mycetocola lacteus TaxID=76637 RepID=UPI001C7DB0BA|nr:ParB-like protein [Mycetocola lacteus]
MQTLSRARIRPRLLAATGIAAALLAAPLALPTIANAEPAPVLTSPSELLAAKTDDLVDLRIGDIRPTQPSVGFDEVYYKVGRYTMGKDALNKGLGDWCEANGQGDVASAQPGATIDNAASFTCTIPLGQETADSLAAMKTVVIGPGGLPYLTDGHHTLTSFAETPGAGLNTPLRLRVMGNLSNLSETDFWAKMQENGWTWLKDVNGKTITPQQLPKSVGLKNFQDDPARSLLYFTRDIGYTAGTIPFQEFIWGDWLRTSGVDLSGWNPTSAESTLAIVKTISEAQVAAGQDTVIAGGYTGKQLGTLKKWNDGKAVDKGEFAKLSKPFSDDKPGKIAYAMAYKATLPVLTAPATPAAPSVTASGTTATISWQAPADGGSPITGYRVQLNGDDQPARAPIEVAGTELSVTVPNLIPGTYSATVTAVNAIGASVASPVSDAVTIAQPTNPGDVHGTLSISGELRPGATVKVSGTGFAPNVEGFALELHSAPVRLATVTTDANGAFAESVTIPADAAAGAHRIVVLWNGAEVSGSDVTVQPAVDATPTPDPGTTAPSTPTPGTQAPGSSATAQPGATHPAANAGSSLPQTGAGDLPTATLLIALLLGTGALAAGIARKRSAQ